MTNFSRKALSSLLGITVLLCTADSAFAQWSNWQWSNWQWPTKTPTTTTPPTSGTTTPPTSGTTTPPTSGTTTPPTSGTTTPPTSGTTTPPTSGTTTTCQKPQLTPEESQLYTLINDNRRKAGLPAIPLSAAMTKVSQAHVRDLAINKPNVSPCNLHSWSNKTVAGYPKWTPFCYYVTSSGEHPNAKLLWQKPKEIANYPNSGYEIAFRSSGYSASQVPSLAVQQWMKSPGHRDTIMNQGIWRNKTWKALGVGIYQGHATAWFGETTDTTTCK